MFARARLEEEIAQLGSVLEEALQTIDDLTSSTAESIDELEDTLKNTAEDAAESKQDAEGAMTLATEAKSAADEAKVDAENALKSSRGMTLITYAALGISLVVAAMNFIGPLQITRKPPG